MALAPGIVAAEAGGIDVAQAKQYLGEAGNICGNDAGKLWGKSLCGAMLFADRATRMVAANQRDAKSLLTLQNGVFVAKLPDELNIANTAMKLGGCSLDNGDVAASG
jgi:hypothetical protein